MRESLSIYFTDSIPVDIHTTTKNNNVIKRTFYIIIGNYTTASDDMRTDYSEHTESGVIRKKDRFLSGEK